MYIASIVLSNLKAVTDCVRSGKYSGVRFKILRIWTHQVTLTWTSVRWRILKVSRFGEGWKRPSFSSHLVNLDTKGIGRRLREWGRDRKEGYLPLSWVITGEWASLEELAQNRLWNLIKLDLNPRSATSSCVTLERLLHLFWLNPPICTMGLLRKFCSYGFYGH